MSTTPTRVLPPQDPAQHGQSNTLRCRNYFDADGNPAGGYAHGPGLCATFQDGPRGRAADGSLEPANGAFVEDLLVAAAQRLEFFQRSRFKHEKNQAALDYIYSAINAMNARATERAQRGVLGQNTV